MTGLEPVTTDSTIQVLENTPVMSNSPVSCKELGQDYEIRIQNNSDRGTQVALKGNKPSEHRPPTIQQGRAKVTCQSRVEKTWADIKPIGHTATLWEANAHVEGQHHPSRVRQVWALPGPYALTWCLILREPKK